MSKRFLPGSTGISIHAPTRGATPTSSTRIKESGGFQSTLPQGERQLPECFLDCVSLFQSTLPQGERRYQKPVRFWYRNFNPRSHKGSDDLSFDVVDISTKISIHAPTRGATKGQKAVIEAHWKFQSTLPQGERLIIPCYAAWMNRFQSTLPQGERRGKIWPLCRACIFQSTLPQGERPETR